MRNKLILLVAVILLLVASISIYLQSKPHKMIEYVDVNFVVHQCVVKNKLWCGYTIECVDGYKMACVERGEIRRLK